MRFSRFFPRGGWLSGRKGAGFIAGTLIFAQSALSPVVAQAVDKGSTIAAAIETGDQAAVQALLLEAEASDLERVYVAGLMLQREGRHGEAADLFRNVLIVVPGARPIREALIQSLVALEAYDGAIFHLDELIETEPSSDRRGQYQSARGGVLARRPYGFSFGLSVVPSSNINRAAGTETIMLGGLPFRLNDQPQSGVGTSVSLGAFRRFSLGEERLLQFNLDATATAFDDPDFNRGSLGGSMRLSQFLEDGSWIYRIGATRSAYNNSRNDNTRYSASVRRDWLQTPRASWGATLGASYIDYDASQNDGFDAYRVDADVDFRRRFGEATILGASLGLGFETPNDPRFAFTSYRLGVNAEHSWTSGWQIGVGAHYEARPYANTFGGIFPYAREDESVGVHVSLANRSFRIRNAVPKVSCSATQTVSNIPLFDDRNAFECAFSLTQRF